MIYSGVDTEIWDQSEDSISLDYTRSNHCKAMPSCVLSGFNLNWVIQIMIVFCFKVKIKSHVVSGTDPSQTQPNVCLLYSAQCLLTYIHHK